MPNPETPWREPSNPEDPIDAQEYAAEALRTNSAVRVAYNQLVLLRDLGVKLRLRRQEFGHSAEAAAQASGLSPDLVLRLERGGISLQVSPDGAGTDLRQKIARLATFLGIDIEPDILGFDDLESQRFRLSKIPDNLPPKI